MESQSEEHGKQTVTITVDKELHEIHRGHQTVAAIKDVGGVPQSYELDQFVDGKLQPLKDDGAVTIKGGEVFASQPRTGHSS